VPHPPAHVSEENGVCAGVRQGDESRRETGSRYEREAAARLSRMGYRILEENFRCRQGEIDLIAMEGKVLVFIEVKYRSSLRSGDPAEAVDGRKRERIVRCAKYFMMKRGFGGETPCRFDVVTFLRDEAGGESQFRLIRDAFWA
jgi:putative endonuclease